MLQPLLLHELLLVTRLPEEAQNDDNSLLVSFDPHSGHFIGSLALLELTKVSNFLSHCLHLYSYSGISLPPFIRKLVLCYISNKMDKYIIP
jgi:hypothetical protein